MKIVYFNRIMKHALKTKTERVNKSLLCALYLWNIWNQSNCIITVSAQCENGFEMSCLWTHSEKSALRFTSKFESGERYIELTNCDHPDCGLAVIQSPWLRARAKEQWTTLHYKVYGYSSVYLRLYMMTEGSAQQLLFSKAGNYAYEFPKTWSSKPIRIPASQSRHRMLLKAYTPYKEALVAVRDINLDGSVIFGSTTTAFYDTDDTKSIPDEYSFGSEEIEKDKQDFEYDEDDDEPDDKPEKLSLEAIDFVTEEDLILGCTIGKRALCIFMHSLSLITRIYGTKINMACASCFDTL
ncbi:uncharacterized protein LOC129218607 [Uloborus diversus]|uniref:uncharacterized protein LOC129218607 n=1 Tax=Uloborus diversus TaxID=327109 RepID=UPI002408F607|nr:uncharacterized protein LOC129218607 [Uloborus diversus]